MGTGPNMGCPPKRGKINHGLHEVGTLLVAPADTIAPSGSVKSAIKMESRKNDSVIVRFADAAIVPRDRN